MWLVTALSGIPENWEQLVKSWSAWIQRQQEFTIQNIGDMNENFLAELSTTVNPHHQTNSSGSHSHSIIPNESEATDEDRDGGKDLNSDVTDEQKPTDPLLCSLYWEEDEMDSGSSVWGLQHMPALY